MTDTSNTIGCVRWDGPGDCFVLQSGPAVHSSPELRLSQSSVFCVSQYMDRSNNPAGGLLLSPELKKAYQVHYFLLCGRRFKMHWFAFYFGEGQPAMPLTMGLLKTLLKWQVPESSQYLSPTLWSTSILQRPLTHPVQSVWRCQYNVSEWCSTGCLDYSHLSVLYYERGQIWHRAGE